MRGEFPIPQLIFVWILNIMIIVSLIYALKKNLRACYYTLMLICMNLTLHCYDSEETGMDENSSFKAMEKTVTFMAFITNLIIFLLITNTKFKFFINFIFTTIAFVGVFYSVSAHFEASIFNILMASFFLLGTISYVLIAVYIILAI